MDPKIEFLLKIRDATAMKLDAYNDYLETFVPKDEKKTQPTIKTRQHENVSGYDIEKISWQNREGPKGPYQISEDSTNPDFTALQQDLEAHKGKLKKEGFFVWQFDQNPQRLGRKKSTY